MNLGAFVLPTLLGYWVVYRTHVFKPTLAQTPPYTFALLCAAVGLALGLLATAYTFALQSLVHSPPADPAAWFGGQLSLDDISTLTVLLVMTPVVPWAINCCYTKESLADNWLVPGESPFDRILREACEHRRVNNNRGGFVEIVTRSSDAYIGFVKGPQYPWDWPDDVLIVPLVVGYRHQDTRHFVPTQYHTKGKVLSELVLPRASVVSVTRVGPHTVAPSRRPFPSNP